MCGARFFRLVFLLIVVSALTVSCLAQAPADTALTNSDIMCRNDEGGHFRYHRAYHSGHRLAISVQVPLR